MKPNRKKMQHEIQKTKICITAFLIMTVMSLSSCAISGSNPAKRETEAGESTRADTGFVVTGLGDYDSADTPVVVSVNKNDNSVTFLNLDIGRKYTLSVDGTTRLHDKYGETISLDQIKPGDIVDVTFLKDKKYLTSLKYSSQAWSLTNVERFEINDLRGEITLGEQIYKLSKDTLYLSEGREIEQMDINAADILSFQGLDNTILSITVEKGHGYLRLANDEHFVGGWIEIGQSQIQKISEDMLLTVPEGSYQVNISHNGSGGTKSVIINRNEETTLDIGDLEVKAPQTGMVLFSITPSSAKLYIDGAEADFSQPVILEYGIHQLIVKAEGYKSLTQYLRVGQASAGIDIVLDKVDSEEETESSTAESTASGTVDATTDYYKVYIDAPEKAEVYVDGTYVGISPCSFKKVAGSHVITLRKTGYETRSYTVQVDEEKKDISYSFADLEQGDTAGVSSVDDLVSQALGLLD